MHDATEINADPGNPGPPDLNDATNHAHERNALLMAPVAALLGLPWCVGPESPGADAIWLDIERGEHVGGRVGLCPFPALDGLMRWTIELADPAGNPIVTEHELLITEPPDAVAARARQFLTEHGIDTPTRVGMVAGFEYYGYRFSDAFPVPLAYVVAYGMALFQGARTATCGSSRTTATPAGTGASRRTSPSSTSATATRTGRTTVPSTRR